MARGKSTLTGSQSSRTSGVISGFVLKLARQSAGSTQERFAEALGVDVTTVQGVGVRSTATVCHQRRRLPSALWAAAPARGPGGDGPTPT